jgi:hypothetical protein
MKPWVLPARDNNFLQFIFRRMLVSWNAYKKQLLWRKKECVSGPIIRSRLKFNMSGSHVAGAIAAGAEFASSAIYCVKHRFHVSVVKVKQSSYSPGVAQRDPGS